MVYNREGYAPWSLTRKAGVQSATVDGDIEVPQYIQPVLDTGFVDDKGDWKGVKSSEEQFHSFGKDEAIANGASILAPQATGSTWPLDMTGFNDLFIALRVTEGGGSGYRIEAVMGPDTNTFANLQPLNAAGTLRGNVSQSAPQDFEDIFVESAQALAQDVWNIFSINKVLKNQKLLQFKITNNTGAQSDIETAFMRLV